MKAYNKGLLICAGITFAITITGIVFFLLSYGTGYIGIVYGEKNSLWITAFLIAVIVIYILLFLGTSKFKMREEICNVLTYVLVVLFTLCIVLLLADRVDAIGNCIVAPWDAGHGGEDSCYLSFVSMGCWFAAMAGNMAVSFIGYRKK